MSKDPDSNEWREERPDFSQDCATSFIFNPFRSLSIENQKRRLPIFQNKDQILYLLETCQVVILVGDTGCGKSTQVPQYLLESGWACNGKLLAVTQPRRIAAMSLASRVAEELGTMLGQIVGYSVRFDECVSQSTRLKYLTEGMILREMLTDPLLNKYCVIMVDEVHERTLNTDILLGLLKKVCKKRHDLRLIISSATLDAEELRNYFTFQKSKTPSFNSLPELETKLYQKGTVAIMNVSGRSYPVDIFYSKDPIPDYVQACVDTVIKMVLGENPGDVLVFLTGQEEVELAVRMLKDHSKLAIHNSVQEKLWILPMHGGLSNENQLRVFQRPPQGFRKVVVATNIAEASVTIPGIVHVIDCGHVKLRWFNTDTQTDALVVLPVSQASAEQRAGRAGRTRPGKVYRLYKESDMQTLSRYTPPEIQRSNLASAVLQLKALGVSDIVHFDFPSPPPARNLAVALELLFALQALDETGTLTDPIGIKVAELPVDPMMAKMLLMSGEFQCSAEIATIVAMMQVQNIFYYPNKGQESIKARIARRKFQASEGDLITYLNVATAFCENMDNPKWCGNNFLNKKGLQRALALRQQLTRMLKRLGVAIKSARGDTECILRCISSSYFPNTAYLHASGDYRTVLADVVLQVHPHSVLYAEDKAPWVVYGEVLQTTQLFMRDITVVEPQWLEELAPHYFHRVTET